MNQDLLRARAAEFAGKLEVRTPQVKVARLPRCWFPDGVWTRALVWQPVVAIGAGYDDLTEAEQEAALAAAVVRADMVRVSMWKYAVAFLLLSVPVFAVELALFEMSVSIVPNLTIVLTLFTVAYLGSMAVWSRRIIHRADAHLATVLGREFLNPLFDLERRARYQRRGLFGAFWSLTSPDETRREQAISYLDNRPVPAAA
ncbi:hypothetical protein [Nocardia sp. NPDC058666]|uniref:hypothetical protein n=1 Tax=Nocardia sp. NPDC058666 TaxID=3346587 RepID=UPI003663F426